MNKTMDKQSRGLESRRAPSNAADAMGLWFAALVLCAVFAAGVIVYRTGNDDLITASKVATGTTHSTTH